VSAATLLAAARDILKHDTSNAKDAIRELGEEVDDVRRRYLAERG
jgi:hypothetical protein